MARAERFELYKAVKHQVTEYAGDCGFTLVELWKVVNKKATGYDSDFWFYTVLADYKQDCK